jgi:dihydroorotate dehydrogenase (fumarate)
MLQTKIAHIILETPIYNASGCLCTTVKELNDLNNSASGAIVSKSSTQNPRVGNAEPRYANDVYGSINSMGVPNFGYEYYMNFSKTNVRKPYFHSIAPMSESELRILITNLNKQKNYLVELNLSCPNLINKNIIAYDFDVFDKYLKIVDSLDTNNLTIGLKLPPYYQETEFDLVGKIINKYQKIKYIVCINSVVNGLLIDSDKETTLIYPKNGLGGIGGIYCRPTTLANIYNFRKRLRADIDIVGCGGIKNGETVFEMILVGASAVQIGTELIKQGCGIFNRINNELREIMRKKKYANINDFKGKLKLVSKL